MNKLIILGAALPVGVALAGGALVTAAAAPSTQQVRAVAALDTHYAASGARKVTSAARMRVIANDGWFGSAGAAALQGVATHASE